MFKVTPKEGGKLSCSNSTLRKQMGSGIGCPPLTDERSTGQKSPGHRNGGRSDQGVPIWWSVEESLLFGVCVVEDAQLVPEEEGENGMRAEAEVGGSYTLVHAKNALCPSCLQQSVQHPPVHEALRAGWRRRESVGKEFVRAHQGPQFCRLPFGLSHLQPKSALPLPSPAFPACLNPRAFPYLALRICGLVVEPCAGHIKGCHG